mmetsp:Transcript_49116/g.66940  ORF Transcript_49116/g.66940 Transcript_49116/m.66940 type:complete len:80 (-) Transcript_49116:710-949(-)
MLVTVFMPAVVMLLCAILSGWSFLIGIFSMGMTVIVPIRDIFMPMCMRTMGVILGTSGVITFSFLFLLRVIYKDIWIQL